LNLTTSILLRKPLLLNIWCFIAAFGAYFCTYAFRKPFFTGQFEGYLFLGISLKTVYIISQVLGYMCSKFIGIKIISELKQQHRTRLVVFLILSAGLALLLFGLIPAPYNIPFLFFNGLPLGMVWGVLFSYLEGRRFTEILGIGLSINMIMTSGILKTIYLIVQKQFEISEFWMPFTIGIAFLPTFFLFVWMLSKIPPPSFEEKALKSKRKPMYKLDKQKIIKTYGLGIVSVVLLYALFTILRDFRDNFAVEIWNQLDKDHSKLIFAQTEIFIASIVMIFIAMVSIFKNNKPAYYFITILISCSLVLILFVNWMFRNNVISPQIWMTIIGIGFYLPYLLIQIAFFERLIGYLKIESNAGFFVYICDSIGYLGSVLLLFFKEFSTIKLDFLEMLYLLGQITASFGVILVLIQFIFFEGKYIKGTPKNRKFKVPAKF